MQDDLLSEVKPQDRRNDLRSVSTDIVSIGAHFERL